MGEQNEGTEDWWEAFFGGPYGELQVAADDASRAEAEADAIERRLGISPGARVLDVPCGTGPHAIELARRGHHVTALDFNPRVLDVARERAQAAGLELDLRVGDMRTAQLPRDMDGAFCWSGSFGYFDDADNRAFLENALSALRPGGRFAMDTVATETIYPRFRPRDWRWVGAGERRQRIIEEREYDIATGTLTGTWTFQGPAGERQAVSVLKLYSYRELVALMTAAGFVDVEAYDGLRDTPFEVGSSRLTLVAQRP